MHHVVNCEYFPEESPSAVDVSMKVQLKCINLLYYFFGGEGNTRWSFKLFGVITLKIYCAED